MNTHTRSALTVAAAIAAATAGSAQAQASADLAQQTVWLQLSAFRAGLDSEIRSDREGATLSGTNVVLERDLGLRKNKALPALLLGVRLGERWRLEFEHYAINRSGRQSALSSAITIDDVTYPVNVELSGKFDTRVTRAGGGFSIYKTPQAEAGLALGIHSTSFKFVAEGLAEAGNGQQALRRTDKNKSLPMPTIGAYGSVALGPGWSAGGRLDLLPLKAKGFKGDLINFEANLAYRFSPNLTAGLGYRAVDYKVSGKSKKFNGRVKYEFRGPQLFVEAGF
ncbi:hypothetical protein [Paucibacter sp. XJ19-41]|uniref:hypothetical protein n=1 Tax=Paucibacter sp. XJ19-41 TaxID=2927824 RepID=UPI002349815A|nr:hypothetical protein [Paucibacter sp. XJ19-41]MDC6169660.1 hypothetical protein [Paucibacter sp. XJ19-41]